MVVNRYYSSVSKLKFTLQNLLPNSQYEIKDLIDNSSERIFTNSEGIKSFEDIIPPGDGRLYKVKPL
jgi:hypothetical protein